MIEGEGDSFLKIKILHQVKTPSKTQSKLAQAKRETCWFTELGSPEGHSGFARSEANVTRPGLSRVCSVSRASGGSPSRPQDDSASFSRALPRRASLPGPPQKAWCSFSSGQLRTLGKTRPCSSGQQDGPGRAPWSTAPHPGALPRPYGPRAGGQNPQMKPWGYFWQKGHRSWVCRQQIFVTNLAVFRWESEVKKSMKSQIQLSHNIGVFLQLPTTL